MSIKVLIADDSAFLRKKVSQILSSHSSIEVINKAKNGEEAVKLALKELPDVLILDLIMPKMNGLEAFKRIMEQYPIPTIILSSIGPATLDSSVQALLIGAFDYIIKPGTLSGESLVNFQNILIQKVKTAYNSRFNKVYKKNEKLLKENISLRQKRVNKIFEFGKFLRRKEPSKKINRLEKTKDIQDVSNSKHKPKSSKFKQVREIETKNKDIKPFPKEEKKKKPKQSEEKKKDKSKTKPKTNLKKPQLFQRRKRLEKKMALYKEDNISKDSPLKRPQNKEKLSSQASESQQKSIKSKSSQKETKNYLDSKIKKKHRYLSALELLSEQTSKPLKINIKSRLVVIGASVGGPKTIKTILNRFPKDFPYPIIIVQHLNTNFIEPFAQTLENFCALKVKVPNNNEQIHSGVVYIAPGDRHIRIATKAGHPCIKLFDGKPVNFCIPSIDVLFVSSVQIYGNNVIGILLTGMGKDGVKGLKYINKNNGITVTESKETAILYGMPKFAIKSGAVQKILPSYKIPEFILEKTRK